MKIKKWRGFNNLVLIAENLVEEDKLSVFYSAAEKYSLEELMEKLKIEYSDFKFEKIESQ